MVKLDWGALVLKQQQLVGVKITLSKTPAATFCLTDSSAILTAAAAKGENR
jgi:hypothetical protein